MAGLQRWRKAFGKRRRNAVRSGGGVLAAACLLVAAVFSGVVLWLTLTAEDTMLDLRARADRAALTMDVPISRLQGQRAGSAADTIEGDDAPTTSEDASPDVAQAADTPVSSDPGSETADSGPEPAAAADHAADTVEPEPHDHGDPAPGDGQGDAGSALAGTVDEPDMSSDPSLAAVLPVGLPVTVAGPDPALMDLTEAGPLPRIGDDGRRPRDAYARPFDAQSPQPRVAIVVTNLGLLASETNAAIATLPGAVTLAFSPHAETLEDWMAAARAEGHEALIMLPMEPTDFPLNDPGPNTLLSHLPEEENRLRLDWALSRGAGYPGVTNLMGSELAERPDVVRLLLQWLNERGLFYFDSHAFPRPAIADAALEVGIPYVANDRTVDIVPEPEAIDRALASLEALARERGYAVGVANAYPVSLRRIDLWARELENRGLVLAPVSAIANPSVDG